MRHVVAHFLIPHTTRWRTPRAARNKKKLSKKHDSCRSAGSKYDVRAVDIRDVPKRHMCVSVFYFHDTLLQGCCNCMLDGNRSHVACSTCLATIGCSAVKVVQYLGYIKCTLEIGPAFVMYFS